MADFQQFLFDFVDVLGVVLDFLVYVEDAFVEEVVLVSVYVRSHACVGIFLRLPLFLAHSLLLFFMHFLPLVVVGLLVLRFLPLFGEKTLDNLIHAWFGSLCLHLQPEDHDGVLQFHRELASVLLVGVIVHQLSGLFVLEKLCVGIRILNNVVKCRLFSLGINKLHFLSCEGVVKLQIFLTKHLDGVNVNVINGG